MSVPKSHSSCRAFAILDAARGDARPGAADGVAGWLSARGVAVLVVESDAKGAGRGRAARSIEDLPRQMDGLEGEVLRGFLANGSAKMGMLALGNRAPEKEVLRALASAYEFILFEMGAADVAGDPGALERLCAFREVPALIVASLSAEGSIALANRAIEAMLALEKSPRPVAFAVTPFDGTAAARLARRWRIASWGDASDFGRISQRMLDRAAALTALDGSAKSSPVSRDSAQRVAREVLGRIREEGDLGDEGLRDRIAAEARRITGSLAPENFGGALQAEVVAHVVDDALGCGPLAPLFSDPDVTEVMVCNARNVYIEREGRIERTDQRFADDAHLMAVIERLLLPTGRRLDEASPAVDARLPDGSRLHAIIPPLSIDGPALTIRRFHRSITGVAQAVEMGMMPARIAAFLCACVRARISIVISGGTGAGKTTLLGALASEIDPCERIITIEDAAELSIRLPHVVRLESRPPNIEGAGAVTIRDLVRNALRMRPDRIVVGECRGPEALDMLQAMNTGHEGSLTTVHANSPRDAVARLETMALTAGLKLPLAAVREQIVRAIDLIVQVARARGGARRVVEIAELTGMEGQVACMQTLACCADDGGELLPTGLPPQFAERLARQGIEIALPPSPL